ncbi:toxin HicA [Agromyces mangrovi Wang et al. 2018]|uniref:toxin HicA n=1 Tax=Agromyces mangrovi TaxID=1858653 RepID=UPI00257250AE|nr:toxin HicA [Agromyces mangrovi]
MGRKRAKILQQMRDAPRNVPFEDLLWICRELFGRERRSGSHRVFSTPWQGDPRVNIQPGRNGRAMTYQVKQMLEAVERVQNES